MRYRSDILALYGQLFADAHTALTKEAAGESLGARFMRRFFSNPRRVAAAERGFTQASEQTARAEKALEEMRHGQALTEADLRLAQGQAARAEEALRTVNATPRGVTGLRRRAMIGGGIGLAGLAGAPLAYGVGQQQGEANKNRTRNIAFGAGAAAGLAAPQVIRGLGNIARGVGQTGLYPELQNVPDFSGIPGGY